MLLPRILPPDTGEAGDGLVVDGKLDFLPAGTRLWLGELVKGDQAAMLGLVDDSAVERALQVADIGGVHLFGGAGALALAHPRKAPVHGLGDFCAIHHAHDRALPPGPDILCRVIEPEMADIIRPALDRVERAGDVAVVIAHGWIMALGRRGVQYGNCGGRGVVWRVSRPWPVLSVCPGRQPKGSTRTGGMVAARQFVFPAVGRGPDDRAGLFWAPPFGGEHPLALNAQSPQRSPQIIPIQHPFLQAGGSDIESAWLRK